MQLWKKNAKKENWEQFRNLLDLLLPSILKKKALEPHFDLGQNVKSAFYILRIGKLKFA